MPRVGRELMACLRAAPKQSTRTAALIIMPLAALILLSLFAIQHFGTARIGGFLGPIMLIWFLAIAVLGIGGIVRNPSVLAAMNPMYAAKIILSHGWTIFFLLGGVFLSITGGEALYADMGHIGPHPIRLSWFLVVMPALLLNYADQVGELISSPQNNGNPFFLLVPSVALYPAIALAVLATIIASQAIITGSFSLTRQAIQLGWLPGLSIRQTSDTEYGQIYVPFMNWIMMIFTLALVLICRSSDRLAGAYGTAVSTTMLLTTICCSSQCLGAGVGAPREQGLSSPYFFSSTPHFLPGIFSRSFQAGGSRYHLES